MNAYDALFVAVAAGTLCEPHKHWWLVAATPLLAFGMNGMLTNLGLELYYGPLAALLVCVLVPQYSLPAFVLALPDYQGLGDCTRSALLWPSTLLVLRLLEERLDEATVPPRLRGAPIRLIACAALYFTLTPLSYLR